MTKFIYNRDKVDESKKTVLLKFFDGETLESTNCTTESWQYIELLFKSKYPGKDIILCYDSINLRDEASIYFGNWNGGK